MDQVPNLYLSLPDKYKAKMRSYPNHKYLRIDIPSRILVVGASGSFKTNCIMDMINKMDCFHRYYLFAKDLTESFYAYLIDTLKEVESKTHTEILTVSNKIEDVPSVDDFDKDLNNLVIVDDFVTEKHLDAISDIFIRGRKKSITVIFITQSYFKTPAIIRQNANYIILKKLDTKKDLSLVLSENAGGVDQDVIKKAYYDVTSGSPTSFFLIDKVTTDNKYKFRNCYAPLDLTSG